MTSHEKALARAVYSRPCIALFDDIFSGLDNDTSRRILNNLFSSTGLFRKWETTFILATQTSMLLFPSKTLRAC